MKKLILVAAPPACGKTYVSLRLTEKITPAVYLDKDDLGELVRAAFAASGREADLDGDFYRKHIRTAEYATLKHLTLSTLRFADRVLVNAPFGNEIRSVSFMKQWQEEVHALGGELLLLWVSTPLSLCYERMKRRNSPRDTGKLADFEAYAKRIRYDAPLALVEAGALDGFMLFDTKDEASFDASLAAAKRMILGGEE